MKCITCHLRKKLTACFLLGVLLVTSVIPTTGDFTERVAAASTALSFPGIEGYTSKNSLPSGNKEVHDGEIIYGLGSDGGHHYYSFSTDQGTNRLPIRVSDDLVNWTLKGYTFYYNSSSDYNCPEWLTTKTTTRLGHTFAGDPDIAPWFTGRVANDGNLFWAPCVFDNTNVDGYYYLYYSVSAYGTRNSNIGVARSKTLDTGWEDCSIVMKSRAGDSYGYNAIDPTVLRDKDGSLWMVYGSFFRGMSIVELDPNDPTKTKNEGDHGVTVASRDDFDNLPYESDGFEGNLTTSTNSESTKFTAYGLEGATISYDKNTDYYYFCVSYDRLAYTYNTRIARSKNITGPYEDYSGNAMASVQKQDGSDSFGTKILAPYAFNNDSVGWMATGHCTMFNDKDGNKYLGSNNKLGANGISWIGIRKMLYTEEGYAVISPEWYAGEDNEACKNVTENDVYTRLDGGEASWEFIRMPVENLINYTQYKSTTYQLMNNKEVFNKVGTTTGNWSLAGDNMTIDFGEYTAKGKLFIGWDWENWCQTVLFTGIADDGSAIWGKQVVQDLSSALLVQLNFDNNVTDSSGNNVGLFSSSTYNTGSLTYEDGFDGKAVRVPKMSTGNALSSVIRLQNGIVKNGNDYTVTMWMKPDSLSLTPSVFFTQGRNTWGNLQPYHADATTVFYDTTSFRVANDGTKYDSYIYKDDTNNYKTNNFYDTVADRPLPTDDWTMVTVTYNNGTSKVYTNGLLDSSSKEKYPSGVISPINNGNNQTYYIGGNQWDGSFDGLIDNFEIYGTALTESEVTALYREQASVSLFKLDITPPSKTTYMTGDKFDSTGMVVKAIYSDGSADNIKDFNISGFDSSTVGNKTITVSYKNISATFTVTVSAPLAIETPIPSSIATPVPTIISTPTPTNIATPLPSKAPVVKKKTLSITGKTKVKRKKTIVLTAIVKNISGKISWSIDKKGKKLVSMNKKTGKTIKLKAKSKKGTIIVTLKCGTKTIKKKIKIQ